MESELHIIPGPDIDQTVQSAIVVQSKNWYAFLIIQFLYFNNAVLFVLQQPSFIVDFY